MAELNESTFPLTTTLGRIKSFLHDPESTVESAGIRYKPDWVKIKTLSNSLEGPLKFSEIVEGVGLERALECCTAEPDYELVWRKYAVWCARKVQHLFVLPVSKSVLDVAEECIAGEKHWVVMEDARVEAKLAAKAVGSNTIADWVAVRALENFYPYGAAGVLSGELGGLGVAECALMVVEEGLGEEQRFMYEREFADAFIQLVTDGTLPE